MSTTDGIHWGNKVTLGDSSPNAPALTVNQGSLYVAWTGTNAAHNINLMSSADGRNWGGKRVPGDTSIDTPTLTTFQQRVYVAWTGTNAAHNITVMSTTNGGASWQDRRTRAETSVAGPALGSDAAHVYLSWAGTDAAHHINLMSADGGTNFNRRVVLAETTTHAPAMATHDATHGDVMLVWTGTNAQHNVGAAHALLNPEPLSNYRDFIHPGQVVYAWTTGNTSGSVWGDGTYTDDSNLGAAVHAGVLGNGQSGLVKVTMLQGQGSYASASRNGVTSRTYGNWAQSYRVEAVRL